MAETSSTQFVVQHPFDTESIGDCILRACDGTEFKPSRAVLSLASPIFRDMFAMPPVADQGKTEIKLPVIPVEEDAETLQALLQMLYPIDPPPIASFSLAQKLVTACDKYFVSNSKLRLHLRDALNDDNFMTEDPLACYSVLWKLGWEPEAIKASRYTHTLELTESSVAKRLVEQSGDIEPLLQLWRMRDSRDGALDGLLSLVKVGSYVVCPQRSHAALSINLNDYGQRRAGLKEKLKLPYPDPYDVEDLLGFQLLPRANTCETCREGREARLQAIRAMVGVALEAYPQGIPGLLQQTPAANLPRSSPFNVMSSQSSTATNYIVKAPFDESSIGDCFLKSSDGASFKASRAILSIASPFFRDMFALPQPDSDTSHATPDLPTIPVEEDAEILQTLLTMLYPLDPPVIKSYEVATKLVRACDKYLISPLRLKSCLRDMLAPEAFDRDPLGAYALTWRLGLEEEAKTASRYTHKLNLRDPPVKRKIINQSGSFEALLALCDMRLQRWEQLHRIAKAVNLSGNMGCADHSHYKNASTSRSFEDSEASARRSLLEPYPEESCRVERIESFFGWTAGTGNKDCANCWMKRNLALRQNVSRLLEELKTYPQTILGIVQE
ncbi:hypothetical protein FRC05_007248 [Tulasnella sp. 425]|nr:hypothetical protein FRC05_007248 [Tulasnella sp. 425]